MWPITGSANEIPGLKIMTATKKGIVKRSQENGKNPNCIQKKTSILILILNFACVRPESGFTEVAEVSIPRAIL